MRKQTAQLMTLILTILLITILAGCGYDNTMYNARKYFKAAQARPLNQNGKPTQQAIDEYTKTIKKCGYILTERKNSPDADDALFLLAQSLYFKGNNQFQAKDQFESLIRNFPKSPYLPQATMFIAQIYRQINDNRQADIILEEYIRRPETAQWHSMALSLLADFAIQDKDFIKAQYWLEKILAQYPKSIEYKEASFLLGKIYYEQQEYSNSINQFRKVVNSRVIKQTIKLDARYYIALNLLLLNETQKSKTEITKLLKIEDRPEIIPQVTVLKGRLLLAMNKFEEANELMQTIIKSNSRTPLSSEAYYWLAEYYYYQKFDTKNALEFYNKAKNESVLSAYATEATSKQAALNQIYQTKPINPENVQVYVENKMTSADNFYNTLDLPDSAFAVIDSVKTVSNRIKLEADSLKIVIDFIQARKDSLIILPDSTGSQYKYQDNIGQSSLIDSTSSDTLKTAVEKKPSQTNSLAVTIKPDTLRTEVMNRVDQPDSLVVPAKTNVFSPADSLQAMQAQDLKDDTSLTAATPPKPKLTPEILDIQYTKQINNLSDQRKRLTDAFDIYNAEYIPYSMFIKASLISRASGDSTQIRKIYEDMVLQYPTSKYTHALNMMVEGKAVRLVDTTMEKEEMELDKALTDIDSVPDSAVFMLDKLSKSEYRNIAQKANFRLGWHYTFEQQDTVKAKPYFNDVIKADILSDYAAMTLRFYSGTKFLFKSDLPDSVQSSGLLDSLKIKSPSDSLSGSITNDSLYITPKTPKDQDSLNNIDNANLPVFPKDEIITPDIKRPDPVIIKPE